MWAAPIHHQLIAAWRFVARFARLLLMVVDLGFAPLTPDRGHHRDLGWGGELYAIAELAG